MSEVQAVECSMCGREGGAVPSCDTCSGRAQNQALGYTLSDHRAGRTPKESRYGNNGDTGPRIVNLPGGAVNHPSGRQ